MNCPSCSADLAPDARFCSSCGEPVIGKGSLADSFRTLPLDPATRGKLETDLEGEQRLVTIVFADMTQSVRRTAGLHPEEAMLLVNDLLEAMAEILVRFGGRIDRFLGDGVLAVFGAPETHEDDPERAVRAALDIQERAEELALEVTVGINTGQVYFGPVGSAAHSEITVMGHVVNLAARLQSRAGPGEIFIGEATQAHVQRAFKLERLSLDIKGIDESVTAYLADRILDDPDKVRGIEGLRSQLVGRDRELADVERHVRDPGTAMVGIAGLAGLGKSRLASELRERLSSEGGRWLEGRCREFSADTAYGPIKDLFKRQGDLVTDSLGRLVEGGLIDASRAAEAAPFLIGLAGQEQPDDQVDIVGSVTAQQRHSLTVAAVIDYLTALAGESETVVFFDDLHWADDLTIQLVLATIRTRRPFSLLGAYRPDPDAPSARMAEAASELAGGFVQVDLHELSKDQTQALVTSLMTIDGLPPAVEQAIVEKSDGNPFYVEEIIRSLIQSGVVFHDGDVWRASEEVSHVDVPESVQAVVSSRVDRLERPLRKAAQVAAVLGRDVEREVFARVAPDLTTHLTSLVAAEILVPADVQGYRFVHALGQEAIYQGLLPSQRAALHELAGAAVEELGGEVDDMAYHYERSHNHTKAVRFMFDAATQAAEAYLSGPALDLFDRGLARIGDLSEKDQQLWTSRYRASRGELLEIMGQHEEARGDLELAVSGPSEALTLARLYRLIGKTNRMEDKTDEALSALRRAEKALEGSADSETDSYQAALIDIQLEKAFTLYFGGRGDELTVHNAAMSRLVDAHGKTEQKADLITAELLDEFRGARWLVTADTVSKGRRGLDLAIETANPARVAEAKFVHGFALLWADNQEEAAPLLRQAVIENERVGDAVLRMRAVAFHAIALRRLGLVEETRAVSQQSLSAAEGLDDSFYPGHALANMCWAEWKDGNLAAAEELGEKTIETWGYVTTDGEQYLNTNFAWLVVWPLVAMATETGETDRVARYLHFLSAPFERPMPDDLVEAVREATGDGAAAFEALELAKRYRLL